MLELFLLSLVIATAAVVGCFALAALIVVLPKFMYWLDRKL